MSHSPVKKTVAATAIAASTLGGIAAGATLFAPGSAGAQDDTDSTETEDARPDFGEHIAEALQPLVENGTLDDAQVDAVIEALAAARPERGDFGHFPRGRHGGLGGGADIAGVLGMEPSELGEALRDGQTIAEIAEAQGVDVQEVVDAIVAAVTERVDTALENDRIDQEKADEILSGATEKAEDLVNGEVELRRRGPGHRFGRGFGPGAPADDAPSDSDTAA